MGGIESFKDFFNKVLLLIKKNIIPIAFISLNFILVIIAHWPWIKEISWSWRPAQTLLTTFWFKQEGISLFSYQTPLFGPPWQVPFEFPLYQAVSAIISSFLSIGITPASHLTSLLIFLISSILLFLICYEYFTDIFTACVIFAVYLWFPFNFFYSNEILIDYTALTFALGFIYLAIKWFDQPTNILLAILAILSLSLGALVKITTIPIIVLPFLFLLIRSLKDQGFNIKEPLQFIKTHITFLILLILMVFIPLLLTFTWTNHADGIKLANPSTVWLTSKALEGWNFGSLSQKLNLQNWLVILLKINKYFFFGASILFLLFSLGLTINASNKVREIIISCFFGSLLTIFIFFNLYNQIQYYIAISAFMSILIGFGLSWMIKVIQKRRRIFEMLVFLIIFGFTVLYPGIRQFKNYRNIVDFYHTYNESQFDSIARKARKITPLNGYIISVQDSWDPEIAFPAERKFFILCEKNRESFNCDMIKGVNYTTVIGSPDSPDTQKVLACFNHYQQIDSDLYRIYPSP